VVRMDSVLCRLFGWPCVAEFKAIMHVFKRFKMLTNERVQMQIYSWLFGKLSGLTKVTLDLDSTVVARNGSQEGVGRGYNPGRHGRASHHPLLRVGGYGLQLLPGRGLSALLLRILVSAGFLRSDSDGNSPKQAL